ncbi:protein kinase [Chloroflexales bacterium ZM16-3]|nr:protein kinase [Chloroflexales bacterium ZM16-3]
MSIQIGQTLGGYIIDSVLPQGSGGIGQVYRAHLPQSSDLVALKVLHTNLASDPKVQERFRREGSLAGQLKHPNIVEIYAAGEENGQLYLVMELITHGSLRGLLMRRSRGSWPLSLGLDLAAQAAEGLAHAHAQGIVHRDIKPENLLLRRIDPAADPNHLLTGLLGLPQTPVESYQLKVADFGVARLSNRTQLTSTGLQPGTPAYMSPEQCKGAAIDGRSDIYALGVVLYEIATGALPVNVDTPEAAVFNIIFNTPQLPRTLNPDLPHEVEAIILRCLEKNPDNRHQTAGELASALRAVLQQTAPHMAQAVPAPRQTTLLGTVAHIQVTPDRVSLALTPGDSTLISVAVTNLGPQVDRFTVTVAGVPPGWVSPSSEEIGLNPNQSGPVQFTVTVPRDPSSRAGDYPVTIQAQSQANPAETGVAQALWSVQPFAGGALTARPQVASGQRSASYTLNVRNDGNIPSRYTLRAEDPRGMLRYRFSAGGQQLDPAAGFGLEPGAEGEIRVEATGHGRFIGSPMTHAITVGLSGGAQPSAASLQFVQGARVPPSLLAIILPLLVLLCGGGGLLAKQIYIDQPANATATVEARMTNQVASFNQTTVRSTDQAGNAQTEVAAANAQTAAAVVAQQTVQAAVNAQTAAAVAAQQTVQAAADAAATREAEVAASQTASAISAAGTAEALAVAQQTAAAETAEAERQHQADEETRRQAEEAARQRDVALTATAEEAKRRRADFSGTWFTNFATVRITQDGDSAYGSYVRYGETVEVPLKGTIQNRTLEGYVGSSTEQSSIKFVMNERGNYFEGNWSGWRGSHQWCGVRSGSLPNGCGFSGRWTLYGDEMPSNAWAQLTQTGDYVSGSYSNGTIEGRVKAWSLSGTWSTRNKGSFSWWFVDLSTDQFRGNWSGSHPWCGSRVSNSPNPCLQK